MNAHELLLEYFISKIDPSKEELNLITSSIKIKKVKKNQFLFQSGSNPSAYFLILKGGLRLFHLNEDLKENTLKFGFENSWIGDMNSFVNHSQTEYNLIAFENSIVLCLSRKSQLLLSEAIPNFNKLFVENYEKALIEANHRILLNIGATAEDRFDDFRKKYGQFSNRIPDRHVASFIGVTPEFFSKLKKKKLREYLNLT
jgi:CRP-like cAMP-binding protein